MTQRFVDVEKIFFVEILLHNKITAGTVPNLDIMQFYMRVLKLHVKLRMRISIIGLKFDL